MTRFVLTKIFHAIITFVLSGIVIFFGVRMLPGDPALAMAGEEATPERLDAIRADLGLDQPLIVQFFKFLGDIVTGDLGESTRTGLAVTEMIATTLPVTLWLSLYAIIVAVIVGITLGMVAERFRGKWPELGSNFIALLGLSVPNFWLGLLAIMGLASSSAGSLPRDTLTFSPIRSAASTISPCQQ
ncbi:ABC transporter permease [Brevibacterium sp. BDJS002]|uniref:ABC transporter permease n=1 Tax=Brevibacterium sp. BDJS002 TaxID=3020906 RepID=UPI002307937B|nr:ABC transporter permease [Brevibacterium sp. BDJS002]WCE40305.1 ABC transporter permease [Brevibacterium sp. BDJS002]